jgi:hypothetical protein
VRGVSTVNNSQSVVVVWQRGTETYVIHLVALDGDALKVEWSQFLLCVMLLGKGREKVVGPGFCPCTIASTS